MNKNLSLNSTVCAVQYCPVSDIIKNSIVLNVFKIDFASGKDWQDLYGTPGSMEFEFIQDLVGGNVVYKQKVSLFFPGMDSTNLSDFKNKPDTLYIVKVTLNNGDEYILGSKENPAQYMETWNTTKKGKNISFWCDSADMPFLYGNS